METLPTNWVNYIQDDQHRKVVPVGRPFQADDLSIGWITMLDYKEQNKKKYEAQSSKWLGTKVWEPKDSTPIDENDDVGQGRPDMCPCKFPGSVECIKIHVTMKRIKLQFELGMTFLAWKFNEMGEDVSMLWALEEEKRFESIVKMNYCPPKGIGFLKPALASFRSRSSKDIVSYYFNVYLSRRIGKESRTRGKIVDTDDEGEEEKPKSKSTRKRCQANVATYHGGRIRKTRFLGGQR